MNTKNRLILFVMAIGTFLCILDTTVMNIALPEIQSGLNVSLNDLSWAINIYTVIFASLTIPLARVADLYGKNKALFVGLITFLIGSLVSGMAGNLTHLLAGRAVQSIGAAIILPLSMVIGFEHVDTDHRNKVVAVVGGAQALSAACGPIIGGFISQYWGWRWIFFINIPFVISTIILIPFILKLHREPTKRSAIDWIGAFLGMVFLFSFSLGLIKGNDWGWTSLVILSLFVAGVVAFFLFVFVEKKIRNPMIQLKLFTSRDFNGSIVSLIAANTFLGAFAVIIPTYLTKLENTTESAAALLITPASVMTLIFVVISAQLIDKISPKLLIFIGFLVMGGGYYLLSNLNVSQNYNQLFIIDVLFGIGFGTVAGTGNVLAAADFTGELLTASQSVANVMRQIGLILAVAIFVSFLTANINTANSNTLHYAQKQVASLNLSPSTKNKINRKLSEKFKNNGHKITSSATKFHVQPIKVSPAQRRSTVMMAYHKVVKKQRSLLIDAAYQKILQQRHIDAQTVPSAMKKQFIAQIGAQIDHDRQIKNNERQLLSKVNTQMNHRIDKKVDNLNHDIHKRSQKIRNHAEDQLKHAFLTLYKYAYPFCILSCLFAFIFKRQKRTTTIHSIS